MFKRKTASNDKGDKSPLKLSNGSQVAVIGGGPAGSFFSYFLLDMAERFGIYINVDIYDEKDFSQCGPKGCNHCGGIISESLVQILAAEGINIPPNVAQRGIDSYILHMNIGSVRIETPLKEKRIAALYRGSGPLGTKDFKWGSFDKFLQELAVNKGANHIKDRVKSISYDSEQPILKTRGGSSKNYELIVGAVGVNSTTLKLFKEMAFGYEPPQITKTYICEFSLGHELVKKYFGNSMHVFLLDLPRLEFAAIIPKDNFVTLVILGKNIDKKFVQSFMDTPEVKQCFPADWKLAEGCPCQCFPKINIKSALKPFADRVVLIGDCATTKLYKNGIGAAYSTAKAAATTAVFHGISSGDFEKHYRPVCRSIHNDNRLGNMIFAVSRHVQKRRFIKRGILRMAAKEQSKDGRKRRMSTVLWDMFTGSAPYLDVFLRTLKPLFLVRLLWEILVGFMPYNKIRKERIEDVETEALGRLYKDGETIINEGEEGDCMYVIQSGKVEILKSEKGKMVHISELCKGEFFGEMALFDREMRSSSVRANGDVRILTVDKKTLLRRIQEDPSMAFRFFEKMSNRIRKLSDQTSRIKASDRRDWDSRPDRI